MYSFKEREIIERCLSIAAWNYRVGKLIVINNKVEAAAMVKKLQKDLVTLKVLVDNFYPAKDMSIGIEVRRNDGFFQGVWGWFKRGRKRRKR